MRRQPRAPRAGVERLTLAVASFDLVGCRLRFGAEPTLILKAIAKRSSSCGAGGGSPSPFSPAPCRRFAFAPFNIFPILWLTVPVFVWLIDGSTAPEGTGLLRRLLPAAVVGWAFGFGFFVAGLWWIGAALLVDADQFAWVMPLVVIALPAGLALFWGFGGAVARLVWPEGWPRILVFASAFAGAEWLRGHLFTGFPWNAFGYALTPAPIMMQSAAIVGLWGLTLAALIIFAAPVALADVRRHSRPRARDIPHRRSRPPLCPSRLWRAAAFRR